jgi:hypothetical protein
MVRLMPTLANGLELTNMANQVATYVSVWDGSVEVRTGCLIDMEQNPPAVSQVQEVEISGQDYSGLDEEYIDVNGEAITTFSIVENGDAVYIVEDGMMVEDAENPLT